MLGRISRIKGQDLLDRGAGALTPRRMSRGGSRAYRRRDVRERPRARGRACWAVRDAGLLDRPPEPFQADPAPLYRWADIVAVPSRLAGSVGRRDRGDAHQRRRWSRASAAFLKSWTIASALDRGRTTRRARTRRRDAARSRKNGAATAPACTCAVRGNIRRARHRPPAPGIVRARRPPGRKRAARDLARASTMMTSCA